MREKKHAAEHAAEPPADAGPQSPERRRLLQGAAAAGAVALAGSVLGGCATSAPGLRRGAAATAAAVDAALARQIDTVVVLYAENRSFNNLFAGFPGLQEPLLALPSERFLQRDRDGSVLAELPPIWGGLAAAEQIVRHRRWQVREDDLTGLPNAPWTLRDGAGRLLPQGVVTHDLWHRFYENQMQINGGRNDGFVAWGNTGAQAMGYYGDSGVNLRLWQIAREFTLCDRWFMGAFGGSFLNHQYLIAARPPRWPDSGRRPAEDMIATLEGSDPAGTRLARAADCPASAMQGKPVFVGHSTLSPDGWIVNTMGPPYAPAFSRDEDNRDYARAEERYTLPPQAHATIGDALSAAGVDWAWYAGGWDLALEDRGKDGLEAEVPKSPNFQPHHQPFNYFRRFAPGSADRRHHLRDGGTGNTSATNRFLADIEAGALPPASFYKPQGNLNLHAGYADVASGDEHLAWVVAALRRSPQWERMLVVITFDENGGWWDHVAPPRADRWGPGTRIPALLVSPHVKRGHVEHTTYDTGSIARFLTRRFGLEKLPGLAEREEAMQRESGITPGDLTEALELG